MRLVCLAALDVKHRLTCVDRGIHGDTSEQAGHARQEYLMAPYHWDHTLAYIVHVRITIEIPRLYSMPRYNKSKVPSVEHTIEQTPLTRRDSG